MFCPGFKCIKAGVVELIWCGRVYMLVEVLLMLPKLFFLDTQKYKNNITHNDFACLLRASEPECCGICNKSRKKNRVPVNPQDTVYDSMGWWEKRKPVTPED
jgi:hypothetical protein